MKNFEFCNPTRILFGKGETNRVGKECGKFGKKVLFVYGGESIKKTGLYNRVMQRLSEESLEVFEWGGIQPNPRIDKVREGVEMCQKYNIDLVLAVGGGSVIDSGKVIAAGVCYHGDPWDFFTGKGEITRRIPLGAKTDVR